MMGIAAKLGAQLVINRSPVCFCNYEHKQAYDGKRCVIMGIKTMLLLLTKRVCITFSSLKYKDYRYFWLGQCISWIGTWMQHTAQVWLVYKLTESPFALGLLGVFEFVPMLLFSLLAGVLVDRFSKKKLIAYTQIGFMLQSFSLAFLVWSGRVEYWHVLLLTSVFGILKTIDNPARQSWFIDLVGKADLPNAISLNSTVVQMSKFIGPMVAGFVMNKYDIAFCFLLKSINTFAVLISLLIIKSKGNPKCHERNSITWEILEGLKHITSNNELKTTLLMMTVFCTFAMNTSVIIPVFADTIINLGVNGYTNLLSMTGIGAFFGAIYMANRAGIVSNRRIVLDTAFISVVHIAAAFVRVYPISIALMFMLGFFSITFLNMSNAIIQINTSDAYRGRVMSVYTLVSQGSHPLGNAFAGTLMEYYGAAMGFAGCGIITLILTGLMLLLTPMKGYLLNDSSAEITELKK